VPIGSLLAFFQYSVSYFTLALAGIFLLCYYNNISTENASAQCYYWFGWQSEFQLNHLTSLCSLVSKCLSIVQQVYS